MLYHIVLIFYNPFGGFVCERGLSEITSAPVIAEIEENLTTETEIEEELEEEPEEEPDPDLSGEVILTIDEIKVDENNTRVEKD